jgi:holin-like protein
MQVIIGFFIILAHLVAGNLLSTLSGGFIPGSVIGMVLMFISLLTGLVKDHQIRTVATFLTDNMTMFFLPAFMGIMDLWGIIKMNIVAWVVVVVVSTIMVLLSTAFVQNGMERLLSKSKRRKS